MDGRECFVSVRLSTYEREAIGLAAEAQSLKVSEWVRRAILRRLSGKDSLSGSLIRQSFAVRFILLNVLLHLGPSPRGLKPERLKELWLAADQLSDKQATKVLLSTSSSPETLPGSAAAARTCQVGGRLTDIQHHAVAMAAEAARVSVADWLRDTLVTQLTHETVLAIVHQQVLALRTILDEAVAKLTGPSAGLDRDTLADLTKRTDPTTIRVPRPNGVARPKSSKE